MLPFPPSLPPPLVFSGESHEHSFLLSPSCGAKSFKMREFCLCLNVSWYVPAGLRGKQSTCMLKAGRQEVHAESPEWFKCKMMRTQEHNIEEGCAKRGCYMFNGYIDECALPHSLGHPVPRS